MENVFLHPGVPKITHTIQYMHFLVKGDQKLESKFWTLGGCFSFCLPEPYNTNRAKMDIGYTIPKSKFGRSYWGLPNSRHALCSWWSTCNDCRLSHEPMKSILDTCVRYHLLKKERTSILEYGVRANLNIDVYIYTQTWIINIYFSA